MERGQWAPPSAQDVVNSYRGTAVRLCADDIILQVGARRVLLHRGCMHAPAEFGQARGGARRGAAQDARPLRSPALLQPPSSHRSHCMHRAAVAQENRIDYSKQRENPLDSVRFFDSLDARASRKLRPDQISSMVVASFQVGKLL